MGALPQGNFLEKSLKNLLTSSAGCATIRMSKGEGGLKVKLWQPIQRKGSNPTEDALKKKFPKPLDKLPKVCYNKYIK